MPTDGEHLRCIAHGKKPGMFGRNNEGNPDRFRALVIPLVVNHNAHLDPCIARRNGNRARRILRSLRALGHARMIRTRRLIGGNNPVTHLPVVGIGIGPVVRRPAADKMQHDVLLKRLAQHGRHLHHAPLAEVPLALVTQRDSRPPLIFFIENSLLALNGTPQIRIRKLPAAGARRTIQIRQRELERHPRAPARTQRLLVLVVLIPPLHKHARQHAETGIKLITRMPLCLRAVFALEAPVS